MRIALASWESLHSVAVGGVAVHVSELGAALARRGHEVHLFTRIGPEQALDQRMDGVFYHRCPYDLAPDFVDGIGNLCGAIVDRFEAVASAVGRFDLVHAHDWLASEAMVTIKRRHGLPGVLTMHSTEYGRCGNHFHGGNSARIREIERRGTRLADRVIAVSRALRREVCWMYELPPSHVTVIYNGVNPRQFDLPVDVGRVKIRYGIDPNDPMVLFVGRLTSQKGPDLLLRATPMALRHHPRARFVFAGDGDLTNALRLEAAHLRVTDACRFLGVRQGRELVELFRSADIVVIPSRNEPFGIVILEAWSAGKPVVATVNGGPSEFVFHEVTGLKVYDTEASLAWGIDELLKDPERARWMGRNGRVAAETAFSWDAIAGTTDQLYAQAAGARGPSVGIPSLTRVDLAGAAAIGAHA